VTDTPAPDVVVRDADRSELETAVPMLARGMIDNPLHIAAFGDDVEQRRRRLERVFGGLFRVKPSPEPIAAYDGDTMVGFTGVAPVGTCKPSTKEQLRLMPTILSFGPGTARKIMSWLKAWDEHDLDEPHVHLGPLAVDLELQGHGIGTRILAEHTRRLDEAKQVGYLETDKEINVRIYERHGYQVVGEVDVIGVPNWFMRRPA
jgi:ribosomal protein S18 acetylase RimI-like enzyme